MSRWVPLLRASLVVLVLGGLLAGCSRSSFVGRQFDDFTAYYNTFYNARTAFEKGLESIEESEVDIDRTRYISIFSPPEREASGESFEKAIQKSADLLREHSTSKWVDDALILIGRSYYYQQNYVGAAQKFREVIALDAEREGEGRFRLAQTLVAAERYADATDALSDALDGEAEYGTWTARMYLLRGELLVRQEQWAEAETALEEGLGGSLPDEVAARGAFLLGQVRETRNEYEGAKTAYERVPTYAPRYPIEFAARLNAIEMQGLHGDTDRALDRLEDLRRGDDTRSMRSEMAVVRSRLYQAQGRTKEARRVLVERLRGDSTPGTETSRSGGQAGRGILHYELGTLYRDGYEDFSRAAAHFDTAATAMSSGGRRSQDGRDRSPQSLPRAPSDAQVQADRFRGLAKRAESVARMDSLLRLGRMDPPQFRAYVDSVRRKRLQEQRQRERERRQQQFGAERTTNSSRSGSSQTATATTQTTDAGFLFYRNPAQVQEGRRQFRQRWGNRPLVDNWRRQSAIQGATADADSAVAAQRPRPGRGQDESQRAGQSLVDVSVVPRDSASQADMEKKRAVGQYKLANSLFRAANRPDSAETLYRRVLEEHADHEVAPQALYALAQAHRAQGDSAAARETYRRVIDQYPETSIAERARQQLGLERAEPRADLAESRADSAYARAYELWQNGPPGRALDSLFAVASRFPQTSSAPKALLAAGVTYHRAVNDTSRAHSDSTQSLRNRLTRNLDRLVAADSTRSDRSGVRPDSAVVDTSGAEEVPADSLAPPEVRADTTDRSGDTHKEAGKTVVDSVAVDKARSDSTLAADDTLRTAPGDKPVPDSTRVNADTTDVSLRPDSARAGVDTSDVEPDTMETERRPPAPRPDSLRPDSAARPDTTSTLRPDTAAVGAGAVRDSVQSAPADTSRARPDPMGPLKRLFTYLAENYPQAPQAKRAQSLLDGLKQRAKPDSAVAGADSTADPTARPDSLSRTGTADSTVVRDSIRTDSTAASAASVDSVAADTTARPAAPSDSTARPKGVPTDSVDADSLAPALPSDSSEAAGGDTSGADRALPPDPAPESPDTLWTVEAAADTSSKWAEEYRRRVVDRTGGSWDVQVVADSTEGPVRYRVLVGRFPSKANADEARAVVADSLQGAPSVEVLPVDSRN